MKTYKLRFNIGDKVIIPITSMNVEDCSKTYAPNVVDQYIINSNGVYVKCKYSSDLVLESDILIEDDFKYKEDEAI